ncbi:MAG: hypothetical protein K0R73_508 [Candidatus Midichloriaceae bacterium]|jgi:hypothetical protein|nr:hypothetical protein [Candidatus Midichloriaceae bacterium]
MENNFNFDAFYQKLEELSNRGKESIESVLPVTKEMLEEINKQEFSKLLNRFTKLEDYGKLKADLLSETALSDKILNLLYFIDNNKDYQVHLHTDEIELLLESNGVFLIKYEVNFSDHFNSEQSTKVKSLIEEYAKEVSSYPQIMFNIEPNIFDKDGKEALPTKVIVSETYEFYENGSKYSTKYYYKKYIPEGGRGDYTITFMTHEDADFPKNLAKLESEDPIKISIYYDDFKDFIDTLIAENNSNIIDL